MTALPNDVAGFLQIIRAERASGQKAAQQFADAVLSGNEDDMRNAGQEVDRHCVWSDAMRLVGRASAGGGSEQRRAFTNIWAATGCHIRQEVGNDLLLIAALRNILPPYEGPALTLFRGDSWANRCRRTYGMSWSSDRQVADDFARSRQANYLDGSCLLEAFVPAPAIISAVHLLHDGYGEMEFVVDRRLVASVRVIERHRGEGHLSNVVQPSPLGER